MQQRIYARNNNRNSVNRYPRPNIGLPRSNSRLERSLSNRNNGMLGEQRLERISRARSMIPNQSDIDSRINRAVIIGNLDIESDFNLANLP
jgi:hypothetical protein